MPQLPGKSLPDIVSELVDVTPAPTLAAEPNRYAFQVETALLRSKANDRRDLPAEPPA